MSQKEEMLEEISGFLYTYLKAGRLGFNSFLNKTNMNINNIEQLLMVRFLLKEETRFFVQALPKLLQNFKTTTIFKDEINIGEIRGAINWQETLKIRLSQNYADPLTFSTTESIRSYNTPENIVLKELLTILYKIVYENDYIRGFERADWFKEWSQLKRILKQALKKNIYLQRVPIRYVSDRIIMKTRAHRNPLYKHAAKLLETFRKLMRGQYTENELKQLLRETFIIPENENVLFELYWVVQLIKKNTKNSKLYLLDGRRNLVASWSDGRYDYSIFHDSAGSDDIQFRILGTELAGSNHPYLGRIYESFQMYNEFTESFFNKLPRKAYHQGRPDFLIEIRKAEGGELVRLIIGEVKNTNNINYASTGMRELLDYIYLVRDSKGNYLTQEIPVEGILCIRDAPWNKFANHDSFVKIASLDERAGILI